MPLNDKLKSLGLTTTNYTGTTGNYSMTAYQQNLSVRQEDEEEEEKWYKGSSPTYREMLAKIYSINQEDPERGKQLQSDFSYLMSDPNSAYYKPYTKSTSQAASTLASYGVDTNELTDDWFQQNSGFINSNLLYNGTTNTPSKPGKNATADQELAYWLYQYQKSETTTKQAENEWAALQEELGYWAGRKDLNLSDDEIIDHVDWNKYKTLAQMDEGAANYTPVSLNRAVSYSRDAMYGVLWNARNDNVGGNLYNAMAMSTLGEGKTWHFDQEIAQKMDPTSDTYNPYSVAMTMGEEGAYFGVSSFSQKWIDENRQYKNSNDATARKYYDNVVKANEVTTELENELDAMNSKIDILLSQSDNPDPDTIIKLIKNNKDYSKLFDLDKTLELSVDNLVKTTRKVDYSWKDIEEKIRQKCDAKNSKKSPEDTLNSFEGTKTQEQILNEAMDLLKQGRKRDKNILAEGMVLLPDYDTRSAEEKLREAMDKGLVDTDPTPPEQRIKNFINLTNQEPNENNKTNLPFKKKGSIDNMLEATEISKSVEPAYGKITEDGKPEDKTDQKTYLSSSTKTGNGTISDVLYPKRNEPEPATETTTYGPMVSKDELKKAYEEKNGVGSYDQDMTTAATASQSKTDTAQAQEVKAQNKKVSTVTSYLYDKMTENERKWYGAMPGINGTVLADSFYAAKQGKLIQGPVNSQLTDPDWVMRMATKQAEEADSSYMGTAFESLSLRTKYESLQKEREELANSIEQFDAEYGQYLLSQKEIPEVAEVNLEYGADMTMYFQMNDEGRYEFSEDEVEQKYDMFPAVFASAGITKEDLYAKYRETAEQLTANANNIKAAKESMQGYTPTGEEPDDDTLQAMKNRLSVIDEELANKNEAYNAALGDVEKADARRNRIGDITLRNSGAKVDPAVANSVLDFVAGFTNWERPADTYDSLVEGLRNEFGTKDIQMGDPEELQGCIDSIDTQIQNVNFVLEQYGDQLPDEYKQSMAGYLEWIEEQKRIYQNYQTVFADDYDELVERGRGEYWQDINDIHESDDQTNANGVQLTGWQQMTSAEQDLYYALYAQQGKDVADQYYLDIEGSLIQRTKENIDAGTKEFAESGFFGRVFNEIYSIVNPVIEVPANFLYLLTGLDGEGNKWLRIPSYSAQQANNAVIQEQKEIYKGTIWGTIVPTFTEMVNNRGRSMVTSNVFGGLIPEIDGLSEGANEIIQSFPIATIAAGETVEKSLDAGLEPWKAYTLGAVSFLSESITEGIKLGNYKGAFDSGISIQSVKNFLLDKIKGLDWLEEAVGETANNIVERAANRYIAGDKSEHEAQKQAYLKSGLVSSEDEAEAMLEAEYLKEDFHTAVTSALGSFLDIFPFMAGKVTSTLSYFNDVQQLRRMGDSQTTISNLRNGALKMIKAMNELQQQQAEISPVREESMQAQAVETEQGIAPEAQSPSPDQQAVTNPEVDPELASQYDLEIIILENAADSDQTTQTANVAAAIRTDDKNGNRSLAAAKELATLFGDDSIGALQDILYGGQQANVNINALKLGIQYAALADGECRQVMNSEEYQAADSATKAQMIANATVTDAKNSAVQQQVALAIHESRVSEETKRIIVEGPAYETLDTAVKAVETAEAKAKDASENLETQRSVESAMADAVTRATETLAAEPTHENADMVNHAIQEYKKQTLVTEEYEQSSENAERVVETAVQELDHTQDQVLTDIRQEAEANVSQMEQQEAQAEVEAMQKAQEEAAQRQAEEDERTGKAEEDRVDALIEDILNKEHLEGEERDTRREELKQKADQIKLGKLDMNGLMSNTEGMLAVSAFGRKLGLQFVLSDDLPDNARGMYKDGVVYLNNSLVKKGKMTIGQALVEASLHEITHSMENTKNYQQYRAVVLDALFGGDQAAYDAAIDQKIEDYKTGVNQELTREQAEKEIIADFARTKLSGKDVVQRFMDAGLGGKIRNSLHNINQTLKNFRLTGEERQTAEYLRRAERSFQKALNEVAEADVHPEGGQFSVKQFAQAAGMTINEETLQLYDADGNEIDGVEHKVTPEMIENTPVGMLINLARDGAKTKAGKTKYASTISEETAQAQKQMFADLMNMVARYKDSNLVWEIASSTLFSAMKSNSDPQYSTTVDFGTVCAKTQEIIDVLSQVMLKEGRGLTREEVLKVYNETAQAGLTVPCPVCYVFSRWMGVPSLLNQMSQYQKRFVKLNEDGSINVEETQKLATQYVQDALTKYGDKEGIDKAKQSLVNRMKTQETRRTDALAVMLSETATEEEKAKAKEKHDDAIAKLDSLSSELGEVEAYNWVTQSLLDEKGKVDSEFELTPDEVLFDLRRTGEFAKYTKNWRYRNTRGAGMGKSIMPYSGETIGDIIYGTDRKSEIKNPFLTQRIAQAADGIKNAIARARKQNLIGGQRLQSTSDFRPEWGLDYMMAFLELQAVGSKVQMYTKVAEAVDLLASMGGDINLSIMGQGQGWHVDENGEEVLDFSDVTGMDYETAKALKNKYDNVQMILVGMNDTHIRLALANPDIDFVIPWHSSGNSKDVLSSMISSVGESLEASSDYTDTQSDAASETQTPEQKKLWDLRMKILQGKKLTAEERDIVYHDKYLKPLYHRFNTEGVDADCYQVKLGKDQAGQIFPYEYWDKTASKADADTNGQRFIEYCQHFGIVPRFSGVVKKNDDGTFTVTGNFAGAVYDDEGRITGYDPEKMLKGYWKTLIDRPMYDNAGNYREQQTVDVTKARIGSLNENGQLVDSDMPLRTSAMYGPEYSEQEKTAVDRSLAAIHEAAKMNGGQYSVFGDETTTADMEQMLSDADADYQDAISRGDMEAAQQDVDFAAQQAGYRLIVYHGTSEDFTYFRRGLEGIHLGTEQQAKQFAAFRSSLTGSEGKVKRLYARINNPFTINGDIYTWSPQRIAEVLIDRSMGIDEESFGGYDSDAIDISGSDITLTDEQYEKLRQIAATDEFSEDQWDVIADVLNSAGYDGIKYLNQHEGGAGDYSYIALRASDVRSADTVVYDRSGNPVPLDQRFSDNPVLQMDEAYFSAVDSGDMEAAQQEVDKAAEQAGYTVKAYHGTPTGGFTQFDLSRRNFGRSFGDGIYYTDSRSVAETFATPSRATGKLNQMVYESYLNLGENPYVVDVYQIRAENEGKPSLIKYLISEAVKNAPEDATSIVVKGIYDGSDKKSTVYVLKSSDQIKSADTVTYDDEGNPIPLSERFQPSNPDIRYSAEGETTDADLEQALIDAGAVTQDEITAASNLPGMPVDDGQAGPQRQWGTHMAQDMDELAEQARQYVYTHSGYTPDTNQAQIERAIEWAKSIPIQEGQGDRYTAVIDAVTSKRFDFRSADGQARMSVAMGLAVARNDIRSQVQIADAVNHQGTELGQALQSRKLFRLMTPEGRIATLQKMLSDQNQTLASQGKNVEIKFSDWVYRAAGAAQTEEEFLAVRRAAAKEIAEQTPVNWRDRLQSFRMLAMLGNPRTHIRNIVGNALFIPAVSIKNKLGAVAELATVEKGERTKSIKPVSSKEVREFARRDAEEMKGTLRGEAKYNEQTEIKKEQKPLGEFGSFLSDLNSKALEGEDWIFLKGHYRRALGGWMEANGYTVEQVQNDPELLEKGRAYAIQEAQKATYRDYNGLAAALNDLVRDQSTKGKKAIGFAVNAVLPFRKTPANILRRGVEYSPVGIVNGLWNMAKHMKQYTDYQSGKLKTLPEGAVSPTQVIDQICSGLSGTMAMTLGYLLAGSGAVSCGLGDDEDELEKLKGQQKYAVNFGKAGNAVTQAVFGAKLFDEDVTFTMDWAAPMSMPFFVGAAIREETNDGKSLDLEEVINAFGSIAEPVFNLSMLDGVNNLLKTDSYSDESPVAQIAGKVVSNYASSYVPSLLGAIARTIDTTRRKAFVKSGEGGGIMGTFRYSHEQTQNKIPFYNQENIPVRDVFGNAEESSLAERVLENFILPGYIQEYKEDPLVNELGRLYDSTGQSSLIPKNPDKKITISAEKSDKGDARTIILSDKEWDTYLVTRGQAAYDNLTKLMDSDYYNSSDTSEAERVKMISSVWDYATQLGKKEIASDFKMDNFGSDPVEYIIDKQKQKKVDEQIKQYNSSLIQAVDAKDPTAVSTSVQALRDAGVEDKKIKQKIADEFRDKYKEAYLKNDLLTMSDIELKLSNTEFDYDFDSWKKQASK